MKSGRRLLIWGATGQAKVLRPVIEHSGYELVVVLDRDPQVRPPFPDVPMVAGTEAIEAWLRHAGQDADVFAIAIGGNQGQDRCAIADRLQAIGLVPITLIHPQSWVAETASLGEGCQVLAMACISEEAVLGRQSIVNTSATVDHESRLEQGVHVMPSATLAGCVRVGDFATIGSNATVLPRISIGANACVGAGAVVTRDVSEGTVVMGVPARPKPSAADPNI